MRPRRAASAPSEPAGLVGIAVLHQLDDGAVDLHERDAKEVVAAAGGVEGLGEDGVPLDRRLDVVDAVGHVGRGAEGPGHRRVGLEAQPLDVEGVGARVGHPDARRRDERLAVFRLVGDEADMVEPRPIDFSYAYRLHPCE